MSTPPQIDRTGKRKRTTRRTINAATAADALGPIEHGCELAGLAKGQFSLVELIGYLIDVTGPAHLTVSTWTAAGADLAHTRELLDNGAILSARWLVDFSFPSRQPAYCAQLRERFGDDAIRVTANHAKFVLIRNAAWAIVVRTSMNLNRNRRLEWWEVSDDPDLADWFDEVIDATFDGDAATIAEAVASPARAQVTSDTLAGTIERNGPELDFGGALTGKGVSYD